MNLDKDAVFVVVLECQVEGVAITKQNKFNGLAQG